MKKLTAVLLATFFAANGLIAQGVQFGVKAGADLTKIDGRSFKEQFAFGYQAGVFTTIRLSESFALQPEVMFGEVVLDTSSNFRDLYAFNNIREIKLQYLKIPILLNYKVNPFVSLQAGPQVGILMNQNLSLIQNGKDAFSKGDFSLLGGLQLHISKLVIYGRYGIGLNNLNDIDNKEKWKSQNIQVGAGIRF